MSPPDDTLPPIHDRETLPDVEASNDTSPPPASDDVASMQMPDELEPPVPVIPAGFAKHAMLAALDDLARVVHLVEATAMAIARQLDAEEPS